MPYKSYRDGIPPATMQCKSYRDGIPPYIMQYKSYRDGIPPYKMQYKSYRDGVPPYIRVRGGVPPERSIPFLCEECVLGWAGNGHWASLSKRFYVCRRRLSSSSVVCRRRQVRVSGHGPDQSMQNSEIYILLKGSRV